MDIDKTSFKFFLLDPTTNTASIENSGSTGESWASRIEQTLPSGTDGILPPNNWGGGPSDIPPLGVSEETEDLFRGLFDDALMLLRMIDTGSKEGILQLIASMAEKLKQLTQITGKLTRKINQTKLNAMKEAIAEKLENEKKGGVENVVVDWVIPLTLSAGSLAVNCATLNVPGVLVDLADITITVLYNLGYIDEETKMALDLALLAASCLSASCAAKAAAKQGIKKGAKMAAKKAAKEAAKKAAKKAAQEGGEKAAREAAEQVAREAAEKAAQEVLEKFMKELSEEMVKEVGKKSARKLAKEGVQEGMERGIRAGLKEGFEEAAEEGAEKGTREVTREALAKQMTEETAEATSKNMTSELVAQSVETSGQKLAAQVTRYMDLMQTLVDVGLGGYQIYSGVRELRHLDSMEELKSIMHQLQLLLAKAGSEEETVKRMEKMAEEIFGIIQQMSQASITAFAESLRTDETIAQQATG